MQEAAQILMDCVADIVDCHGLGPLRSMCEAMQLQRVPSGGGSTSRRPCCTFMLLLLPHLSALHTLLCLGLCPTL